MSALRSPCLTTTVRSGRPLARAASMKSDESTSIMALRVMREVSAIMPSASVTAGQQQVACLVQQVRTTAAERWQHPEQDREHQHARGWP